MITEPEFRSLYEDNYVAIHAFCVRRVGPEAGRDAAAEVFTVAWRRREDIPADAARRWLYGVARNTVLNGWRAERRQGRLFDRLRALPEPGTVEPDLQLIRADENRQVVDALRRLRPADREILVMSAWDELANVDIAEILGISAAAADQRLHRAKQRLARALDELTASPPSADGSVRRPR